MVRKTLLVVCLFALAAGAAFAVDMKQDAGSDPMAMHMAAMMNCDVCRKMMPHMETLGPAMTMDVAMLNDGVSDDPEVQTQLAELGAMCQKMCEMVHPSL